MRAGDVLLFANGMRVDSAEAYMEARNKDGSKLDLIVQRGNRILELCLDLSAAATASEPAPKPGMTFS